MRSKICFLAIVSFWLVMNYLLWRSELSAHSGLGNAVPVAVVWDKILTAPDSSTLELDDHDKKIGVCHWLANVGDSPRGSNRNLSDDYSPFGMVEHVTGYTLTFEGNATLPDSNRIRFDATLNLSSNRDWQNFHVRASLRPTVWDVRAAAAAKTLTLKVDEGGAVWQKTMSFAELRNPEALLGDLGPGFALGWLAGAGQSLPQDSVAQAAAGVEWQAHEDWMQFGHSKVRVYRVETVFLAQRVVLFISRAGEILEADLPDKLTLRNDAFSHF
jgi:hypothetical protein